MHTYKQYVNTFGTNCKRTSGMVLNDTREYLCLNSTYGPVHQIHIHMPWTRPRVNLIVCVISHMCAHGIYIATDQINMITYINMITNTAYSNTILTRQQAFYIFHPSIRLGSGLLFYLGAERTRASGTIFSPSCCRYPSIPNH